MSLQTLYGFYIPNPVISEVASASGTQLIDAAGEKAATVFRIPRTGVVIGIGFRTAAVSNSQTLRVSLQTVDASTGFPSGSNYGGSAAGTQAAPAANTAYVVTLATPATVTQGDVASTVIEFDSAVGNVAVATMGGAIVRKFPYTATFTSSWGLGTTPSVVWLVYLDGSVYPMGTYPYSTYGVVTFNNSSTPDEYALRFRLPFPARVAGYWLAGGGNAAGSDFEVVLYDNADTVLATESWDGDLRGATGAGYYEGYFTTPVSLAKDTVYRLAFKPTTTANVNLTRFILPDAAVMGAYDGGGELYMSSRVNGGAWTDATDSRPLIGLILDQFDDGTSGGGGSSSPIFIFSE